MFRSPSTLVLLLLVGLLPGVALAQNSGTLAGRVTDAQTGDTLPGANVVVQGTTLGAATNLDGEFRIIGVPVGTYNVTASFAGYQELTLEGVDINSGATREVSFELGGSELGTVEVVYERPIIQQDAIGVPRVVSGEDLENLPIRSVAGVTALQGGVVSADNTSTLNIRGGRGEEVAYYVDGVRVTGLLGVNQQAIQEQEVLIGTIPARYGDVQSGVISITTKTGRSDFFGSAEVVTSQGLDSFGDNLASLSLGGPIAPGRVGFFLSGEYGYTEDNSPYGIDTYRLNDDLYQSIQDTPQALRITNAEGGEEFVNFPVDLIRGLDGPIGQDSLQALLLANNIIGEGSTIANGSPVNRVENFTASDFDLVRGKRDPNTNVTLNGNLNFDLGAVNLRLGGGLATSRSEPFSFTNSLYNRETFQRNETDSYRLYGTFLQRLSNSAFYQIQGEFQDNQGVSYPDGFSSDINDVLQYGDVNSPANQVAQQYYVFRNEAGSEEPVYVQQFDEDGGGRPGSLFGYTFSLPGRVTNTGYSKSHNQRYRFSGNATTQVGVHQLEFGGEYQQDTRRFFSIGGYSLSRFVNDTDADGNGGPEQSIEGFPDGITSYDQLPYTTLRGRVSYYGYDFNGLNEINDQDVDSYFDRTLTDPASKNLDAYRPRYYAGYIQDKIEFQDLIIQLGFRADVFDNNTLQLKDIYAPTPIQRVDDMTAPAGIESDFAVYYNGDNVVGYRDTDGNFYDSQGSNVPADQIITTSRGQVRSIDAPRSTVFEEYTPQATFMPRVGVSFPVTDRALFFASYNVTSQRPTEAAFATLASFDELDGQQRTSNPTLEPERTTQYELGFRQRLGERAALSVSGFYRTQDNKISVRQVTGGFPAYSTYFNADFTTTQGAELNFDLRRTNNLSINANYTLSFAQGTGSDANSTGTAAWRGDYFPQFISPSDFDQRHTANVSLDYRFGAGEGPMLGGVRALENFGVNLIGQFGSGLRYTRLERNTRFNVGDSFTENVDGTINGAQLPATSRLDLRVDRAFNLGFSDSRVRAYVSVINLLDTENVLAVYRSTGLPNEDGFVNTAAGRSQLDTPGRLFNYQAYTGGPVNVGGQQSSGAGRFYGSPRQIRLGLLFDF